MLRYSVLAFLTGCASVGHRAAESLPSPPMLFASVRFDSARDVTFVPQGFVLVTTRQPITSVLELGGRVIDITDDSVVVEPSYVIVRDTTRQLGRRTLWRGRNEGLPLLAVVRRDTGMYLGAYRPPRSKKAVIAEGLLIVGPGAILFLSSMYGFFTSHW